MGASANNLESIENRDAERVQADVVHVRDIWDRKNRWEAWQGTLKATPALASGAGNNNGKPE